MLGECVCSTENAGLNIMGDVEPAVVVEVGE
jgi:hypothetical protein